MKQLIVFIWLCSLSAYSQKNVDNAIATFKLKEIALLNIEPNNTTVLLSLGTPDFPGEKLKLMAVNNSKWINFTSAVSKNGSPRNLSIKIEDGNVPEGISLKVKTENYTGNGKGELGNKGEEIVLNKKFQTIVSNIRGAYTGFGINNGYKLTYILNVYDYKLLKVDNSEVLTISLTLSDF